MTLDNVSSLVDSPGNEINHRIAAQARGLRAALGPMKVPRPRLLCGIRSSRSGLTPASRYLRRNVSRPHWPSPIQIVEVEFPAGARVAYETGSRDRRYVLVISAETRFLRRAT